MQMEIGVYRIESAILTAIESARGGGRAAGGGSGNSGRNILRARDYQYAPDTTGPFFLGERKRNEVPGPIAAKLPFARKLEKFRAFLPASAGCIRPGAKALSIARPRSVSKRNRLHVLHSGCGINGDRLELLKPRFVDGSVRGADKRATVGFSRREIGSSVDLRDVS